MMDNGYWYEEQQGSHFSGYDKGGKRKAAKTVSMTALIACMLVTALLGGAVGGFIMKGAQPPITNSGGNTDIAATPPPAQDETAGTSDVGGVTGPTGLTIQANATGAYSKAQIVEKCAPSIVGIDVEATSSSFWYGERDGVTTGSGSGIIITSDGYIITNNHVISGANKVTVYLNDDTEYEAKLVGTDEKTDLAVIKIEATGLTPVSMGNSEDLMVGEEVIAIGNPLGELRGTATGGMVSALSRTITFSDGSEMTLMQTDAAINPGNSGGGLFNSRGELVGIVNAKVASSSTEGLGFAIPVSSAKKVIADLMDLGYVSGRAQLGVFTQDVAIKTSGTDGADPFRDFFGFGSGRTPTETRVQVVQIILGTAADDAGIQAGDLILKVDDTEVTTGTQLSKAIGEYSAGDVATITIQRDGKQQELSVTFTEKVPD